MNGDLVDRIAAQLLSPYWKDRLSGSSRELPRAFYERYLHGVKLQPAEPIEPSALEGSFASGWASASRSRATGARRRSASSRSRATPSSKTSAP